MTKHSPGPWTIGFKGHNINMIYGGDGIAVAQTFLPLHTGVDEIPKLENNPRWASELANARLIAAAPDLLAAVRACEKWIVDLAESGDAGFWDAGKTEEVKAARAAIAKATGEA